MSSTAVEIVCHIKDLMFLFHCRTKKVPGDDGSINTKSKSKYMRIPSIHREVGDEQKTELTCIADHFILPTDLPFMCHDEDSGGRETLFDDNVLIKVEIQKKDAESVGSLTMKGGHP